MNKKIKAALWIVCFAAILAISGLAYNMLSERYKPETRLTSGAAAIARTVTSSEAQASTPSAALTSTTSAAQASTTSETQSSEQSSAPLATQASTQSVAQSSAPSAAPTTNISDESAEQQPIAATSMTDGAGAAADPHIIQAPDFLAYDGDGNAVRLSNYFGQPVVLNFWASWCPPCKSEMPHFDKVYGELKGDVVFLMVDLTDGARETVESGKQYVADNGFTFPVLFDNDQDAAANYGVRSIPTTYFIDVDGNIIAGAEGAIEENTLLKGIGMIYQN